MNGKKGITDLIRGDATCPYMKNIPGLKKDFEVFKKAEFNLQMQQNSD